MTGRAFRAGYHPRQFATGQSMELHGVDLNLLKIFDAVYAERSVSRAALRIGLTQPSVSHGLTRLRLLFSDPLFVRHQSGMAPTVVADRVAAALGPALRNLQAMLDEHLQFDPVRSTRTLRVYMTDFGSVAFLPGLLAELRRRAPGITLELPQIASTELAAALDAARLDLAVGYLPHLHDQGLVSEPVLVERYVELRRAEHAQADADYAAVTSHPQTLEILRAAGLESRIRLWLPNFMVLPALLARNDLAVLLPRNVADQVAQWMPGTPLQLRQAPGSPPLIRVSLHWHRRYTTDPGLRWFRDLFLELYRDEREPSIP